MATGTIKKVFSSGYVSASSVTTEQLKNANVVIAHYKLSDNTTISTIALIPNENIKGLSAVWNGAQFYYTVVSLTWSKSNGTVTIRDQYSERSGTTVSIVGYYLIF